MNNKSDDETSIPVKLTPTEFAEKYKSQQGQVKGGSLCFWGHWFGKPYDNYHQITSVDFDPTTIKITIRFSEQETLTVTNPADITEYKEKLVIADADNVYWQWHYYGNTQEPGNLFYYDISRKGNSVTATTNVKRHKPDWKDLTITKPAVMLT